MSPANNTRSIKSHIMKREVAITSTENAEETTTNIIITKMESRGNSISSHTTTSPSTIKIITISSIDLEKSMIETTTDRMALISLVAQAEETEEVEVDVEDIEAIKTTIEVVVEVGEDLTLAEEVITTQEDAATGEADTIATITTKLAAMMSE